jgi:toxin ParE1/3/4
MPGISFHPEALAEYSEAAHYYLWNASPRVAEAFSATIEMAAQEMLKSPFLWRVIEEPGIRRYVCRRFPYVIYYRSEEGEIRIYAVMHCSRKPGYWKHRFA